MRRYTPPHLACGLVPKTRGAFTPYHPGISPPNKNMSNTTSISAMIYTKNTFIDLHCIQLFIVRLRKLPYFLGDYPHGVLPAQEQKCKIFEKNHCITRKNSCCCHFECICWERVVYSRARPRNFYTQNSGRMNSHRTFSNLILGTIKSRARYTLRLLYAFFSILIMSHLSQMIILLL